MFNTCFIILYHIFWRGILEARGFQARRRRRTHAQAHAHTHARAHVRAHTRMQCCKLGDRGLPMGLQEACRRRAEACRQHGGCIWVLRGMQD